MAYCFQLIHTCREGDSNKSSRNVEASAPFTCSGYRVIKNRRAKETAWARKNFGPGCISPKHSYYVAIADEQSQKVIATVESAFDAELALRTSPEELRRRIDAANAAMDAEL